MWSDIAHTILKTTTNNCESFHRHFGELFNSRKGSPNIYEFMEKLDHVESFNVIKGQSTKINKGFETQRLILKNTFDRFQRNNMTATGFLTCISRKVRVRKSK